MTNPLHIYPLVMEAIAENHPKLREWAHEFTNAVPFHIQQVYDWLCMEKTGDSLAELLSDMPTCRPPFEWTFFEWSVQDYPQTVIGHFQTMDQKRVLSMGALVYTHAHTKDEDHSIFRFRGFPINPPPHIIARPVEDDPVLEVPVGGCVVWIRGYVYLDNASVGTLRNSHTMVGLDADGNIIKHVDESGLTWMAYNVMLEHVHDDETDDERNMTRVTLSEVSYTSLFACSLLHCKNVSTQDNYLPRQQRRDRQRHNLPPIEWKTLVVTPHVTQRNAQVTYAPHATDYTHKRQHVVRGHFSEYGYNGKGLLFGRIQGRFWVPPHIRGMSGPGVLIKDYDVHPTQRIAATRAPK